VDHKNKEDLKNKDDLKNEEDFKKENNLKNEMDLENVDDPSHILEKLPKIVLMTSHRDSHTTTDVKPEMIPGF